jgi:hypothetical protein
MKQLVIILAFFCCQNLALGQGWWRYYPKDEQNLNDIKIVQNNGLCVLRSNFSYQTVYNLLKIDANGKIISQNKTPEFAPKGILYALENKNFIIVIPKKISTDTTTGNSSTTVYIDSVGKFLKTDTLPSSISLLNLGRKNDSIFYSINYRTDSAELVVFNINKKEIISRVGIEKLTFTYNASNVRVISAKNTKDGYQIFLLDKEDILSRIVLDDRGGKVSRNIYQDIQGVKGNIEQDNNGNTFIWGQKILVKINKEGNVGWQKQTPFKVLYQGEERDAFNMDFKTFKFLQISFGIIEIE